MGLFKQVSPEEQALADAEKARRRAAVEQQKAVEAITREHEQFLATPLGQARTAFANGDALFQVDFPITIHRPKGANRVEATNSARSNETTETLNAIYGEGWELMTGGFVFVVQAEDSRNKVMSSGQNVEVKGETRGYYIFRRDETRKTS